MIQLHFSPKRWRKSLFLLWTGLLSTSLWAQQWALTWSDEFNGAAGSPPALKDWNFENGWGPKDNHEIQWYCEPNSNAGPCEAKAPNLYEDGKGNLVLRAIHVGNRWSSARLNTAHKHQALYGRVEARLRFDSGEGFWPAFWLPGSCNARPAWPTCGELDVMEWVQKYETRMTSSAAHGPGYSGAHGISRRAILSQGQRVDDGQFHTYGVTWSPRRVEFYRDNPETPFFVLTPDDLPAGAKWVYDHPFYVVFNFAVSEQGFGGNVSSMTPRTGSMWVDYVRFYQKVRQHTSTR